VKHFSLIDWVDFVRAVAPAKKMASMQKHLDENCGRCRKTMELWTSIIGFAKQEVTYEPPASALRIAESYIIPLRTALRQTEGARLARLTFDSFERQATAGIRGFDPVPRQLMYRCGNVFIDMRLVPAQTSDLMVIVGQVMDSQQPGSGVAGIPVSLLRSGDTLFETTTNQLGEFHFSFRAAQRLGLLFGMKSSPLLLQLPDADAEPA
jgi:hypothetical protein